MLSVLKSALKILVVKNCHYFPSTAIIYLCKFVSISLYSAGTLCIQCAMSFLSAESAGVKYRNICCPFRQPKLLTKYLHCKDHKESPCSDCFCSWVATYCISRLWRTDLAALLCCVLKQRPDNSTLYGRSRHGVVAARLTSERRYTSIEKHFICSVCIYTYTHYGCFWND
jgi:hypothetical protein